MIAYFDRGIRVFMKKEKFLIKIDCKVAFSSKITERKIENRIFIRLVFLTGKNRSILLLP